MQKIFFAVTLALVLAGVAAAQTPGKIEGFAGVSVASFDTGLGNSGLTGANDRETAFGFDSSVTGYLNDHLGIEGNVDGHFKTKTFSFPGVTSVDARISSFNFLGGPHYRFSPSGKVTPFVRALGGVNHSRVTVDSFTIGTVTTPGITQTENSFAVKVGGGVDLGISQRAAVRLSADYNPIFESESGNLNPGFGGRRTRNDVVFSVGIVIK